MINSFSHAKKIKWASSNDYAAGLPIHSNESKAVIPEPASQVFVNCTSVPYYKGEVSISYSAAKVFESFVLC